VVLSGYSLNNSSTSRSDAFGNQTVWRYILSCADVLCDFSAEDERFIYQTKSGTYVILRVENENNVPSSSQSPIPDPA
jgi:hypothetical protein